MPYVAREKYRVNLSKVTAEDSIKTLDEAINLLSVRAKYTDDAVLLGMQIAISELKKMKKKIKKGKFIN